MTPEQQAENIECLKAHWNGETDFQYEVNAGFWIACTFGNVDTHPIRRKPKPALVPWDCKEDVPLNCWVKHESNQYEVEGIIASVSNKGFTWIGSESERSFVSWDEPERIRQLRHSTDRKTWHPCSKLKP